MEVFILGHRFKVNDGKHGWAVVKYESHTIYVNALVVSEDTPNYTDIVAVSQVITDKIKEMQRMLVAEEVYDLLVEKFGGAKVICEAIENARKEAETWKPIEYKGYMVFGKKSSYKDMRGYFLEDKDIHVCGYDGMSILIQCKGSLKVRKLKLNYNTKGIYFNFKGKRIYVDYVA